MIMKVDTEKIKGMADCMFNALCECFPDTSQSEIILAGLVIATKIATFQDMERQRKQ